VLLPQIAVTPPCCLIVPSPFTVRTSGWQSRTSLHSAVPRVGLACCSPDAARRRQEGVADLPHAFACDRRTDAFARLGYARPEIQRCSPASRPRSRTCARFTSQLRWTRINHGPQVVSMEASDRSRSKRLNGV
jgi:hypothetical protein